ncbi:Guanine nucleotide-binding protein alpha-2 subunit [Ascosphaera aggregata]|nr:Guanine nucleotide-binding protein alpha-2 subunit [Ascosphaera aggregata]
MGACLSSSDQMRQERLRSQAIDKMLEQEAKKRRKECKILLLGAGESGKSTIVKQMKILHQNGYSQEELQSYRGPIYSNLMECAISLIQAMREFDIKPTCTKVYAEMEYLSTYQLSADPSEPISPAVGEAMTTLWSDSSVPALVARQNEFYFMDSAAYMFDVGGQRSERRKWIHCFENVTAIIFCVALNEFDQVLLENKQRNRLLESLDLFGSVINSRWFMRTGIILFMNKIDLFPMALERSLLSDYFKEYTGPNDPEPAAKFILWRFTCENRAHLTIYPHLTQATDTRNIQHVFDVVSQTLLQNALKDTGIIL